MFRVETDDQGGIRLVGKAHAGEVARLEEGLAATTRDSVLDCSELDYISSAGLGVLLDVHKRLQGEGGGLKIANLTGHVRELFRIARFDQIFTIL